MNKRKSTVKQENLPLGAIEKQKTNFCLCYVTGHIVNVSGHLICRIMPNSVDSNACRVQKDVWQPYLIKYP